MAAVRAFQVRLLDLMPIYTEGGRRLVRAEPPEVDDERAALVLVELAVHRWVADAVALAAEQTPGIDATAKAVRRMLPASIATPDDARRAHDALTRLVMVSMAYPRRTGALHPMSVAAAAAAEAAAEADWDRVGELVADCLHARGDDDYAVNGALEAFAQMA